MIFAVEAWYAFDRRSPVTERTFIPTLALVASILLSAALTAFATDHRQAASAMGAAGDRVDAALSETVEARLKADPGLTGSSVTAASQSGIVTLSGRVPDDEALRRALETASNIRGVREVRSDLVIEPRR